MRCSSADTADFEHDSNDLGTFRIKVRGWIILEHLYRDSILRINVFYGNKISKIYTNLQLLNKHQFNV